MKRLLILWLLISPLLSIAQTGGVDKNANTIPIAQIKEDPANGRVIMTPAERLRIKNTADSLRLVRQQVGTKADKAQTDTLLGPKRGRALFRGSENVTIDPVDGTIRVTAPGSVSLADVNATPGQVGSGTEVPIVYFDSKGRATAVSKEKITPGGIGAPTTLPSLAALRSSTGSDVYQVDGLTYKLDVADNASADDFGTVIVRGNGQRYKLQYSGTVPLSIFKNDGASDSTALRRALRSNASIITTPANTTLNVNGLLTIQNAKNKTLRFGGPVLSTDKTKGLMLIQNSTDIRIEGGEFGNTQPVTANGGSTQHAIHIDGSERVVIDGIHIRSSPEMGVAITNSYDVTVQNSVIENTFRDGTYAHGSARIRYLNNHYRNIGDDAMSFHYYGDPIEIPLLRSKGYKAATDFIATGNTVENAKQGIVSVQGRDGVISQNILKNIAWGGIVVWNREDLYPNGVSRAGRWLVDGNQIDSVGYGAKVNGVFVSNNAQSTAGRSAVYFGTININGLRILNPTKRLSHITATNNKVYSSGALALNATTIDTLVLGGNEFYNPTTSGSTLAGDAVEVFEVTTYSETANNIVRGNFPRGYRFNGVSGKIGMWQVSGYTDAPGLIVNCPNLTYIYQRPLVTGTNITLTPSGNLPTDPISISATGGNPTHTHSFTSITGVAAPSQVGTGTPSTGKYLDGSGAWVTLPASNTVSGATYAGSALIIVDFNSLGAGRGSSHEINSPDDYSPGPFPVTMMNTLATQFPGATFAKKNFSVSGRQTPTMISNSTQVDALFAPATYDRQIIVSGEITNHIADGGATAQQAIDSYVSYCKARRAKGFLVVATTVLPRTSFFGSGISASEFESRRTVVNDYLKLHYLEFADVLADVNTISGLTYPDGTHTNDAGYVKMGNFIASKVAPLLVTGFNPQSIAFLLSGTTTSPPSSTTASASTGAVIVLNGQGANNSTTFTDGGGHTFTASGNAKISTTQAKIGSSSMFFDGSSNTYISTPSSSDFNFGAGDFTMEVWLYRTASGSGFPGIMSRGDASENQWTWCFPSNSNRPEFYIRNGGSYTSSNLNSSVDVPMNQWVHLALTRQGTTLKLWQNGTLVGTGSNSLSTESTTTGKPFLLGGFTGVGAGTDVLPGYFHARVTKGTALYTGTSSFTPPTSF